MTAGQGYIRQFLSDAEHALHTATLGNGIVTSHPVDTGVIDGVFVNGSAYLMRGLGWMGSQLQTGRVGTYAWVIVLGAITLLSAFSFR